MSNLHLQGAADAAPKPESDSKPDAVRPPDFVEAVREVQRAGKHWIRQLGRSHKDHAEFAAQVYAFAAVHRDTAQLVAALRAMGVKVPKSTHDKHYLLATKLAAPKADPKAQSNLSRALGHIQARRPSDQPVMEFIAKCGGVDACARAYSKEKRAAAGAAEHALEAGIDRLRALIKPAELVGDEIMPDEAGVYLLVAERRPDGVAMSYGFVADAKLIDRACRMVGPSGPAA